MSPRELLPTRTAPRAVGQRRDPAAQPGRGTVLYIEDDRAYAGLVVEQLAEQPTMPFDVEVCARLGPALDLLAERDDIVCVLLDLNLPDARSLEGVERLAGDLDAPPVVVLTGRDNDAAALTALRIGADDYLLKRHADGPALERAIRYAIERQWSRREIAERERFARSVLDSIGAQTAVLDGDGVVLAVNAAWQDSALANGGDPGACGVGANYLAVCDRSAAAGDGGAAEVARGLRAVLDRSRPIYEADYECSTPQSERWFILRATPLAQATGGAVVIHTPVTELKRTSKRLEHLALHDPLTGLPNRSLLARRLADALEGVDGHARTGLLLCDLDGFKQVNDELGHPVGDAVLVEVGRRLQGVVRPVDTVGRLSGDEFVLLVPGLDRDGVERLGERILDVFDEPLRLDDGSEVRVGLSVGLALAEAGADPDELLRDADAAMYRAKEGGRRRLQWVDDRLRSEVLERLALRRDLHRGLELDEMRCYHQPLVDLADGTLFAVESLVRWDHPTRGFLDPGRFVPGVESAGAATRLLDHVLGATLAAQRRWAEELGWTPAVTVNLTASGLRDESLADLLAHHLDAAGASPSLLWLEVGEAALAAAHSLDALGPVSELGVRLAVDEVGAGVASLPRLATLPVGLLKLSRGVVGALGVDPAAARLVEATVALAHTLGIGVAAVGIETRAQRDVLAALGCDLGQGFLLGHPEPETRLGEGLAPGRRWVGRPDAEAR